MFDWLGREASKGTAMADTVRINRRGLDQRPVALQDQPAPSHSGTVQLAPYVGAAMLRRSLSTTACLQLNQQWIEMRTTDPGVGRSIPPFYLPAAGDIPTYRISQASPRTSLLGAQRRIAS